MAEKLAIDGGPKTKITPFGSGRRWDGDELKEIIDVLDAGPRSRFEGGKVAAFEAAFAEAFGVPYAMASTSGTASLHLAVGMVNPNPGDEIITAPITDLGSVVPILYQGAIPVFADVDPQTFNMDPASIEANITSRTAAIMVVHLFGNPCDMDAVTAVANKHGIPVIEDCSQAHMARWRGRPVGTIGDAGAFSLQASKHITTGEGGMTVTSRDDLAERGRYFTDKGWRREASWDARRYDFLAPNYRMPELLGAVGLAQLRKLESFTSARNKHGDRLSALIADAPGVRPQRVLDGGTHTYWNYSLAVEPNGPYDADQFAAALRAEGVPAGAHYIGKPIFLCARSCWDRQTLGDSGFPYTHPGARDVRYDETTCPAAADVLNRLVILGMSQFYTDIDIEEMGAAINKVARGLAAR